MATKRIELIAFGAELRRLRIAAGMSLTELAGKIHFSKSHLSKVETGFKAPSQKLIQLCEASLSAPGALTALVTYPADAVRTAERISPMAPAEINRIARGNIDEVRAAARTALPAISYDASATQLDGLRGLFDHLRRLGHESTPGMVLPLLATAIETVKALPRQPRTLVLASFFLEYAGWMQQERGDDLAALDATDEATELAAEAGYTALVAYGFVRRAEIALYQHDAIGTIALARRAQEERCDPRVLGLASQREAQGHAMAGDYESCRRALDRASHIIQQSQSCDNGQPILGTTTVDNPVAVTTGWCLFDLHRYDESAQILAAELAQIPASAYRSRTRYAIRLARALASHGEPEAACAAIEPLLPTLPRIDSATIRVDLRGLVHELNRWPDNPAVRSVRPSLAATLRSRSVSDRYLSSARPSR